MQYRENAQERGSVVEVTVKEGFLVELDAYFPALLANGQDAVLIGPTGMMVDGEFPGPEQCVWYKAGRFIPEARLSRPVPSRLPPRMPRMSDRGTPWKELAPLGRAWYEVYDQGTPLPLTRARQYLDARTGKLHTEATFGGVAVRVTTFLHRELPLLCVELRTPRPMTVRAGCAPGPWRATLMGVQPPVEQLFDSVRLVGDPPEGSVWYEYVLDGTVGWIGIWWTNSEPCEGVSSLQHHSVGAGQIELSGVKRATLCFTAVDARDALAARHPGLRGCDRGALRAALVRTVERSGFGVLEQSHEAQWSRFWAGHAVDLGDEFWTRFYELSLAQLASIQDPVTGALPVNLLRSTWSGHVFWDAAFIHRALVQAGHYDEALHACRFLWRTADHARQHAGELGGRGMKWDWELTPCGERAYGQWSHQALQVHNNGAYAAMIWTTYLARRDPAMLLEFYPLLRGMAEFFLDQVIVMAEQGLPSVRPLVGVDEAPDLKPNEVTNLSAALFILGATGAAARVLGIDDPVAVQCITVGRQLFRTLDSLYNGRFFQQAPGVESPWRASLAPVYLYHLVDATDPRALATAQVLLEIDRWDKDKRIATGGEPARRRCFPWHSGQLAATLFRQGLSDEAWEVLEHTRMAVGPFGGMAETVGLDGAWNMMYFSTAQAAVVCAIHESILQGPEPALSPWLLLSRTQAKPLEVHVFRGLPSTRPASFTGLVAAGCQWRGEQRPTRRGAELSLEITSLTKEAVQLEIVWKGARREVTLDPGQSCRWEREWER